jgi:hypothetical protein
MLFTLPLFTMMQLGGRRGTASADGSDGSDGNDGAEDAEYFIRENLFDFPASSGIFRHLTAP